MDGEVAGSGEIPSVELNLIPEGAGDTIFDDIFNWIANAIDSIVGSVTSYVSSAWGAITDTVASWVTWAVDTIKGWWQSVLTWVQSAVDWAQSTYALVSSWVASAFTTVYSAVYSAITTVHDWLNTLYSMVSSFVSSQVGELWLWISGAVISLGSSIYGVISELSADVSSWLAGFYSNLQTVISTAVSSITATVSAIIDQVQAIADWLTGWLEENIVKPLGTWWQQFMDRILDFPGWIGKLFDAVEAWLTVDVPGHSPRWTAIFDGIGHWLATWFYEFPKWFFQDVPERVAYGLGESFKWVGETLSVFTDTCIDTIMGFVRNIGPVAPSMAGDNAKSILTIANVAIGGLLSMTVAGELLHPLKQIGLGNLAAMVYDMTNYRLITGAFFGALTYALIRLPAQWYYYDVFRPQLPSIREGSDFFASDDIDLSRYSRLLAYHGIPDEWHPAYVSSAYRAPSPYQLSIAAAAGTIDEDVLEAELRRGGYHPDVRAMYLDSFRKLALGNLKAVMVASATGRFKKGYTDDAQLTAELKVLNVGDQIIPQYIAGARLDYATAYLDDLVDAYTAGVRSGQLGLTEYRQRLLDLGIAPDRVGTRVLTEKMRLKPRAATTPIAPPTPEYTTDSGKLQVDTLRRRRRKGQISRDQEINGLLGLGMDNDYATAIADNDDIRLTEKGGGE